MDDELHRVLRIKAAELERTISDLVMKAVKQIFQQYADDVEAFEKRKKRRVYLLRKR